MRDAIDLRWRAALGRCPKPRSLCGKMKRILREVVFLLRRVGCLTWATPLHD